jgi:hypothetical protein
LSDEATSDDGLSEFERRFVEAYMGDAHGVGSRAVKLISPDVTEGSARTMAYELLRRPLVRKALRERVEADPLVASRLERLRYLTRVVRGEEGEERFVCVGKSRRLKRIKVPDSTRDRMAACEMLAKAAGEHLPLLPGDDESRAAASMTMAELFALMQGGTRQ